MNNDYAKCAAWTAWGDRRRASMQEAATQSSFAALEQRLRDCESTLQIANNYIVEQDGKIASLERKLSEAVSCFCRSTAKETNGS